MIDQLVTTLRALVVFPAAELATDAGARLAGDCADAARLELDCPQQLLAPGQRTALRRLSDLLDAPGPPGPAVPAAARDVLARLGLPAHPDRALERRSSNE